MLALMANPGKQNNISKTIPMFYKIINSCYSYFCKENVDGAIRLECLRTRPT